MGNLHLLLQEVETECLGECLTCVNYDYCTTRTNEDEPRKQLEAISEEKINTYDDLLRFRLRTEDYDVHKKTVEADRAEIQQINVLN